MLLLLLAPAPAGAQAPPRDLDAAEWLLIDADSGEVLARHEPGASRPIASATKLMTAYLALRELEPRDVVTAPAYDAAPGESLMGLQTGEEIRVRDLLYGMLLPSGNDAAAALATAVSGSVPGFVTLMNRTADRLGLDGTTYGDPIGLDPASSSSAADLVALTKRLRHDPLFRKIVDTPQYELESGAYPRTVVNRNNLVLDVPWVNGVKTGRTLEAGYVLVSSGKRKGIEFLAAVLGAPSEAARDMASLELLDYGASLYRRRAAVTDAEVLASASIRYRDETVPLLARTGFEVITRDDQDVALDVQAPTEVEGPIDRGERLGVARVSVDGAVVGQVPVVAGEQVDAPTLIERADDAFPGGRGALYLATALAVALAAVAVRALLRSRPV